MTNIKNKLLIASSLSLLVVSSLSIKPAYAASVVGPSTTQASQTTTTKVLKQCGGGVDKYGNNNPTVTTSIDIGCHGVGNPITDMIFGIIRFLSAGVGLVIVGSIILAGIQYSASGGDPQAAAKAKSRISSTLIALVIFIFSYSLLNYLIPGGFFNG